MSEPKSARPLLIAAAAVVVLLVAIAGFVALSGGGGDGGESSETTEVRSTPQDPTGGAAYINAPTNVKATMAADGSVAISWTPPTEVDDVEAVRYRIERTDPKFEDPVWMDDVKGEKATHEPVELNADGGVCVVVSALVDDVISDPPSNEVCTNDG